MKTKFFCLSCYNESYDDVGIGKSWDDFCPHCGADHFREKVDFFPSNDVSEHIYMSHGIDALKEILSELLYCTELNLDEMEPHTCEVIRKANNLLNFIDWCEGGKNEV